MKKLFAAFIALLMFTHAQSQELCGTAPPDTATLNYLRAVGEQYRLRTNQRLANQDMINVPIQMHIVPNFNGSKYDYNTMLTVLCELNTKFQPAGIRFWLYGVNYINEPTLYNHTSYQVGYNMLVQYNEPFVVNTFFVNLSPIGLCGYAFFPNQGPGTTFRNGGLMMSVGCSQIGNTTLAHEMGHYLALPHPFDGTSGDPASPISERVTRLANDTANNRLPANCHWAGDMFCDTRADFISSRWSCAGAPPTQLDVNGDLFDPDETLYMSYSLDACANRFSEEQINTMRHTLVGDSVVAGSRNYLQVRQMPAVDPITSNSTPLFPNSPNTVVNSDWAQFGWSAATGATHYLFRILRSNSIIVYEAVVADTQHVLNSFPFTTGTSYTWTVRPYNHAYTCAPTSTPGQFRAGQNFATSLAEQQAAKIKIYPTLLNQGDAVQIDLSEAEAAPQGWQLTLVDMHGRTIHSQLLQDDQMHQVRFNELQAGLYQLRLQGGGLVKHSKIVVQ